MLQDMYRLNQPKPDIRFNRNGIIYIIDQAAQRMNIGPLSRVSFYVDQEQNLFIRPDTDGLRPIISRGKKTLRIYSKQVTDAVLSLPDLPQGLEKAAFRIGTSDDGINYPVITRRLL